MELTSDKPLFHCKVKYIGSAEPTRKVQGIEAVQEPLRSVYGCVDNDIDKFTLNAIDVALTVLDNGLQLTFIADPAHVIVFPISTLFYCSALRFCPYNASNQVVENPMFVFVDSDDADAISNSVHPPIFSVIFQRNRTRSCMECHSFVCANTSAALQLVEACQSAYNRPDTDFSLKDSKYPFFYRSTKRHNLYRHEDDDQLAGEIIEIPNKGLARLSSKIGSPFVESFFYGTASTPVVEFAFNPDFLRRVHGYQSLRRSVGAGYNSFGTRDSIGSAVQGIGGGVVVQRPMNRRRNSPAHGTNSRLQPYRSGQTQALNPL